VLKNSKNAVKQVVLQNFSVRKVLKYRVKNISVKKFKKILVLKNLKKF